jgi:predicted esterase
MAFKFKKMIRLIFLQIFFVTSFISFGQRPNELSVKSDSFKKHIERITNDQKITVDSAYNILSSWNQYPTIKDTKKWYLFVYKDSIFGTVPLKIYIPENYQSTISSSAVLILHGAVGMSSFKDAYKDTVADEDIFYKYFEMQNFIVIRPFADRGGQKGEEAKHFDWVVSPFYKINKTIVTKTNRTFPTLTAIITQLKAVLNIDDNKIFSLGHSDGSDGTFALEVYKPSLFAGFVAYNSMLTTIFSRDTYLRNTLNRPLYLVHSSLDDLRPIEQTRSIIKILDSINSPVLYKEYIGYQHYDKHLQMDLPLANKWMKGIERNPFQNNITWEMSDSIYNTCDWLKITKFDTALSGSDWQSILSTKTYNKKDKTFIDYPYFKLNKSVAVTARYNNNIFELKTSRIKEVELLISPVMVNLQNPVVVKVNGKEVFNNKVAANKTFLLNKFASTFDRKALWVASIKVNAN